MRRDRASSQCVVFQAVASGTHLSHEVGMRENLARTRTEPWGSALPGV